MYATNTSVWIAFGLYLAATFYFAYLAHRKTARANFLEDFFVAGRDIGPWVLALTWLATMASGGTFVGAPSLAHHYGWPVMLWISGYIVVATTGMGIMGKRIAEIGRRTGALTFPDLLRDRYESKWIGVLSGILVVVLHTAYMVAQSVAGARLVEPVLGVPYLWGILGFAITVAAYTAYGGFRAVAWTDSFQAVVMLFGILLTAYFAIEKAGGLSVVFEALNAESPDLVSLPGPDNFLPLSAAISFFFVWPLSTAGQPSLLTRFLACRDARALKRATFLIGAYIFLLYPAIITMGIVGRVIAPDLQTADHATAATILAAVPPFLAGFVLAAPMAAIMSTLSSFLLVSSSAVVRDLYQRNFNPQLSSKSAKRLTEVSTYLVAIVAFLFALRPPEFLQYIVVFAGTGLTATFLFPTLLGVYWPRMNKAGCFAGIVGGFLSFIVQYALYGTQSWGGFDPYVWSLLASLICSVGGCWLSAPPPKELRERYFGPQEIGNAG